MSYDYASLKEGQLLEPLVKPEITKMQLVKYCGASLDFNLLHTDDEFARTAGLDGVIAHGMLIMGFLGEYLTNIAGGNAELSSFKVNFGGMTKPGDVITCSATVQKVYEESGQRFVDLKLKAEKVPGKDVLTGEAKLKYR